MNGKQHIESSLRGELSDRIRVMHDTDSED